MTAHRALVSELVADARIVFGRGNYDAVVAERKVAENHLAVLRSHNDALEKQFEREREEAFKQITVTMEKAKEVVGKGPVDIGDVEGKEKLDKIIKEMEREAANKDKAGL